MAEQRINGHSAMGQKYKEKNGHIQKMLYSLRKNKKACLVRMIDHYVKHIFREHSQEADHLAKPGD